MSTTVELSPELANCLDERSRVEEVTPEEVIRRALRSYLAMTLPSFEVRPANAQGAWPELSSILGTWRNPDGEELVGSWEGIDGLAYQRRIRAEWDR